MRAIDCGYVVGSSLGYISLDMQKEIYIGVRGQKSVTRASITFRNCLFVSR